MNTNTENYLNFSDEILGNLIDMKQSTLNGNMEINEVSLTLLDNVINEYCNILKEISKEKGPEFIELGNIALDILKTGMQLKIMLESKNSYAVYAA
jgi:hypothetical protein